MVKISISFQISVLSRKFPRNFDKRFSILKTGTWSFSVQHFSKYELAESDDEIDENEEINRLKNIKNQKLPTLPIPRLNTPRVASPLIEKNVTTDNIEPENTGLGGLGGVGNTTEEIEKIDNSAANLTYTRQTINSLPTADTLLGCQKIQVKF